MKRSILVTLFGLFVFVLYLVLAIKSYSKWDDGFGTDYSMDMDLFILCICGLIILILGLYDLYLNVKVKNGIELNVKKAYIDLQTNKEAIIIAKLALDWQKDRKYSLNARLDFYNISGWNLITH